MSEQQIKLLIIDDEESILDYSKRIFKKNGYITFGARDGGQAVEIFEKERPEISIIDIFLVGSSLDGIDVLRKIKEIDKDAICIMVTRITSPETIEESKQLGALHYMMKPLSVDDIKNVVEEAADMVRQRRSNGQSLS